MFVPVYFLPLIQPVIQTSSDHDVSDSGESRAVVKHMSNFEPGATVQAPLKASSTLSITLSVKTSPYIASVVLLITVSGVYTVIH